LDTAVLDLLAVMAQTGLPRPILVGQSWGGNVVLELGWRRPEVARGIVCVDGGLIELSEWYPSWDDCLAALAPPRLDHLTLGELAARIGTLTPKLPERAVEAILHCFRERPDGTIEPRLTREHHLRLLRALWEHRPSTRLAGLAVPLLLLLADTGDEARTAEKRRAEARARGLVRRVRSQWFAPAHPDVHAQLPDRMAAEPAERSVRPSPAALARLRAATYVFAGPGSPSYALSVWRDSPVPEALVTKLVEGGAVVFASAAALTLGAHSLPVYEIYKVGH